jgi:hypothetical protein
LLTIQLQREGSITPLREDVWYRVSQGELDAAAAILLLENMGPASPGLSITGKYCNLDFEYPVDRPLTVEISDVRGFWAISEVSLPAARRIIMMVQDGDESADLIPETQQEWDAYGRP